MLKPSVPASAVLKGALNREPEGRASGLQLTSSFRLQYGRARGIVSGRPALFLEAGRVRHVRVHRLGGILLGLQLFLVLARALLIIARALLPSRAGLFVRVALRHMFPLRFLSPPRRRPGDLISTAGHAALTSRARVLLTSSRDFPSSARLSSRRPS